MLGNSNLHTKTLMIHTNTLRRYQVEIETDFTRIHLKSGKCPSRPNVCVCVLNMLHTKNSRIFVNQYSHATLMQRSKERQYRNQLDFLDVHELSDVKCICWTYLNVSCTNVVYFIFSDCISHLAIPPLLPLTENLAACSPKIWRRNRLMRASRVLGQAPKPQNCKTISKNMTCMLSFFHFFHHFFSVQESCPNQNFSCQHSNIPKQQLLQFPSVSLYPPSFFKKLQVRLHV